MYIPADKVRQNMNESGLLSRPFLFAVDFEIKRGLFIENPLSQQEVLFRAGNVCNDVETYNGRTTKHELSVKDLIPVSDYSIKFESILKGIRKGDSYLANLTLKNEVATNLSLIDIFRHTRSPFGICCYNDFVCFSPERFVFIEKGIITSCPMKGTIDASVPDAAEVIMNDYKEICEHNTIVDLIRNDLGKISDDVWVERFRYIDKIATDRRDILQISSEIKGRLSANYKKNYGDIIFSLLPAGSVSGAPKSSTTKLISESEKEERGFYTGVFGYFNGYSLDSAVLIRFIERAEDGRKFYRSGGGITVNSIYADEYDEIIEKIYIPGC